MYTLLDTIRGFARSSSALKVKLIFLKKSPALLLTIDRVSVASHIATDFIAFYVGQSSHMLLTCQSKQKSKG